MSDPLRVLLLGATGLVGRAVMDQAVGRTDLRLNALTRREVAMPEGARMEVLLAPVEGWQKAMAALQPDRVICALGTTIRKESGDKASFTAVDRDLVLNVAGYAKDAGAKGFVVISSVGADRASKNFYLQTKGDMEAALGKVGFQRLDILRPGLLRGPRVGDRRPLEKLGSIAAPLADLAMRGERRKYRSIKAADVGAAALQAAREQAGGRFIHHHDEILRLAARLQRG